MLSDLVDMTIIVSIFSNINFIKSPNTLLLLFMLLTLASLIILFEVFNILAFSKKKKKKIVSFLQLVY